MSRQRVLATVSGLVLGGSLLTVAAPASHPAASTPPTIPPVIVLPTDTAPPTTSTTTGPPTTTTTAPPTIPPVIVTPTTTTSTTTTSTTSSPTTITSPPTTPTTTPNEASPTTAPAPSTTEAPTVIDNVAIASVPPRSGDEIIIGEFSGDPADWSDQVLDFLAAESIDANEAGGPIGPAGGPGVIVSNEGCAVQCITSGVAFAVGTGAHLRVTTSTPATIRITVFGDELAESPGAAVQWGHTWPHLHHDTIYTALVRAEDADGNVKFASGDFHTLNRYARMDLTAIGIAPEPPFEHPHVVWWPDGGERQEVEGGLFVLPLPLWEPDGRVDPTVDLEFLVQLHDHEADCSVFDPCSSKAGPILATTIELDTYPETATYWTSHEIDITMTPPCIPPTFCDEPAPVVYSADIVLSVWYAE